MMNLGYILQTRNILPYLISQRKWGGIMKILFPEVHPDLVDAVRSVCLAFVGIETQFVLNK